MKKKAVLLMRDFRIGGGQKATIELVNRLDRSLFELEVIVLDTSGPLSGALSPDVKTHSLLMSQGNAIHFIPRIISLSAKLRCIFAEIRPDVVVGTSWFLNLAAGAVVKSIHTLDARLILINHTPVRDLVFRSSCFSLLAPLKRRITAWLFQRADRVVAITDVMRSDLQVVLKLPDSKVVVIRNGICCETTRKEAAKSTGVCDLPVPYFLFVGRLELEKGADLLLDAFELVAHTLPHRLLVVGDGTQLVSLMRRVAGGPLHGRVVFVGELSNPYPAMKHAEFLVLPSRWDAFPYVLLESLALDLPIIATDCEGPVNILGNGAYGLVVERGDHHGLADAISRFATDKDLRDSFRGKSSLRAIDFSMENMMSQYEKLFGMV